MNFSLDVICLNCPHFIMLPPSIQKETLTQICNSFDRMRLFIFLHKFGVMDGVLCIEGRKTGGKDRESGDVWRTCEWW
jgi:hypothetical protein